MRYQWEESFLLTEEKLRFVIEVRSTSLVIGSQIWIVPQKLHKLLIAFIPRVTLFPKLRRGIRAIYAVKVLFSGF